MSAPRASTSSLAAICARRPWSTAFLLALVALTCVHASALFDPPYWDALVGAFPQGLWLAQHDFDLVRLLTQERTCPEGGPNVYPFSPYPLAIGALYAAGLEPRTVFLVVHLVVLVSAAATAASAFELARGLLGVRCAVVFGFVFAAAPLFHSLTAQMNMDMPLCAATLASLVALVRGRVARAWGFAFLALLILPRGVVVAAANGVVLALAAWRPRSISTDAKLARADGVEACPGRASALRGVAAHGGLVLLFVLQVVLAQRFSSGPAFVKFLGGFEDLVLRVVWIAPEFAVLSLASVLAATVVVVRAVRGTARWSHVCLATFVLAYFAFFGQYTNTLVRYFLQPYAVLLLLPLALLPRAWSPSRALRFALALAFVLQVANHTGRFYPKVWSRWSFAGAAEPGLVTNDGHVLERSMEYREDLLLTQELATRLERFDRERTVVVACWPLLQAFAFPEFGYVGRAWITSTPIAPLTYDARALPWREVYDTSVRPVRQRVTQDVVWVLAPSVYVPANLVLQERLDVVLDAVQRGRLRAFLVRRAGWEPR
ncbi:MAG: hypothetical protein IPJ77_24050 [Planctomycetes bacterium]|nr:hypothetical protein [Planctomycetota bacterium]